MFFYVTAFTGSSDGQAPTCNVNENNAYAGSVIFWDNLWKINLPHEIGHLFGIDHQEGANGCSNNMAYCHEAWDINTQINSSERRVTSVWTGLGSKEEYTRYYSNPWVKYQGLPAGILNEHFAADAMSERFCEVANFRTTLDFMVNVVATPNQSTDPDCPDSYTLQPWHNSPGPGLPGQAPYSYEWRSSRRPFFSSTYPGTIESTTASFVYDNPGGIWPNRYMQLKVTGSDGYSLTQVRRLRFCRQTEDTKPLDFRLVRPNQSLRVYPNPASINGSSEVKVNYPAKSRLLRIMSVNGEIVKEIIVTGELNSISFDTNDLRGQGIYAILAVDDHGASLDLRMLIVQ